MRKGKWEIPLKGGDEYDAISGWRKVIHHRPGDRKATKRKYRKRCRQRIKADITEMMALPMAHEDRS